MKKILFLLFIVFVIGCKKDPLDITPDGRITLNDVFKSDVKTGAYLNTCYNYLQFYGYSYNYYSFLAVFTDNAHDNDDPGQAARSTQWYQGELSPTDNPLSGGAGWNHAYYGQAWQGIRKCNVFLANIDDATVSDPHDRARWKAEAKILRAYYYWDLIRMFGGMPIEKKPYGPTFDYSTLKRASFDSCVQFIVKDCQDAIAEPYMPWRITTGEPDRARMTKAVAYAIESEATLFNASPLWNPENDLSKWKQAAEISKEALNELLNHGYALYPDYGSFFLTRPDISDNPADKETILEIRGAAGALAIVNSMNGIPSLPGNYRCGGSPSQELVDAYDMDNGKPAITGYSDADHLHPIINAASGYDDTHPYKDRDPRFYATVFYNGAFWGNINGNPHYIESYVGGSDGIVPSTTSGNRSHSQSGYYLKKFINTKLNATQHESISWRRFRLAEIYLNLAEAENEAYGPDKVAYDAINAIRERAGMPDLPPGLTKDEFRKRVHRERRVEFAFEGNRFWDVRRWKILDQTGKLTTGMRWTKNQDNTFTGQRFVVDRRKAWKDKFLMFPLGNNELADLPAFTQNPGY